MRKKIQLQLMSLFLIPALIVLSDPNKGFAQAASSSTSSSVPSYHKTWEQEYAYLDHMVTTSSTPKHKIQRDLTIANFFALGGLLATVTCANTAVMDVNVWLGGSIYFLTYSQILKHKEKKLVEKINNIRKESGGWTASEETQTARNATTNSQNEKIKKGREDQAATMELVLMAQREAIDLIKKKNNLLKHMTFIYGASATILGIMLVKSWQSGGNDNTTLCRPDLEGARNKVEKVMVKIRDEIMMGFSIMSILPMALGQLKKTSHLFKPDIHESLIKEYESNLSILDKLNKNLTKIYNVFSSFIIADSIAMNPINPSMDKEIEAALLKEGETFLGNTLFQPYVRLGLYSTMMIYNSIAVTRNDRDIGAYREKIDYFEKDLNALKSDTKRHLSLEEQTQSSTTNNNLMASTHIQNNNLMGCIKMVNNQPTHDPLCECAKTNSCMSFSNQLPPNTPQELKDLVKDVDKHFAGDNAWIHDEKKSDEMVNRAMSASDKMLNDVNLELSKKDKGIDLKGNVKNMIKSLNQKDGGSKLALASSGGSAISKDSSSSSGIGDYSFPFGNSGEAKPSQGGVYVKDEIPPEDIPLNDIHTSSEDSVFDVVSLRYKKTAFPRLLNASSPR